MFELENNSHYLLSGILLELHYDVIKLSFKMSEGVEGSVLYL